MLSLKEGDGQQQKQAAIPGISANEERSKKINKASLLKMISRLQEGDIDTAIISRVRNRYQEGMAGSLFHDRIFWLDSCHTE